MSQNNFRILVVDDEKSLTILLSRILKDAGYQVETALSGEEAQKKIKSFTPNLVITDLKMPGISGLELLKETKKEYPEIDFILLTAYATVENAVEAMKEGALDYLVKPLKNPEELRLTVSKAVEHQGLIAARQILKEQIAEDLPPSEILFAGMDYVKREVLEVAPTNATVLLLGESGTGKTLIAKAIHHLSGVKGAFVCLNCGAIPENLIESELFGHEKGAFTGAIKTKRGKFELAQNGTIFLDEIGEMPLAAQAKLLRVLQDRSFERIGGTTVLKTNARIIAATNQDLSKAIEDKRFRQDLYYRLSVFPITLPPLRERKDAIGEIAQYLIRIISAKIGKKISPLTGYDIEILTSYNWPGNVRELYNVLERAIILSKGEKIALSSLLDNKRYNKESENKLIDNNIITVVKPLKDIEKEAIIAALKKTGGHRKKTAELLGISVRTLQYKIKQYGLSE